MGMNETDLVVLIVATLLIVLLGGMVYVTLYGKDGQKGT